MPSPLTGREIPDFLAACAYEHVFGSRAVTALSVYGPEDPAVRFFLCRQNGAPSAALCLADGVLTLSATAGADLDAIAALARREGVWEIDAGLDQCQALRQRLGGALESSYFMVYPGEMAAEDFPDIRPGTPREAFAVLRESHEYYRTHLDFDRWSADLERRLSRGLSELYLLRRDGGVVATGCLVSQDETCGVIGAVAVLPAFRHQGLGSRISRFLVGRIRAKGKTPRLIAGYDAVAQMYRQVGFVDCGRWGELYL